MNLKQSIFISYPQRKYKCMSTSHIIMSVMNQYSLLRNVACVTGRRRAPPDWVMSGESERLGFSVWRSIPAKIQGLISKFLLCISLSSYSIRYCFSLRNMSASNCKFNTLILKIRVLRLPFKFYIVHSCFGFAVQVSHSTLLF